MKNTAKQTRRARRPAASASAPVLLAVAAFTVSLLAAAPAATAASGAPQPPAPTAPQPTASEPSAPQPTAPEPVGTYSITLHSGNNTEDPVLGTATLNCFPMTGSTHPRAFRTCVHLARANGDFAKLSSVRRPCAMIYKPVTVAVRGVWRGERRDFAHTYGSQCVANAASDSVFDLSPSEP